MIVSLWAAQVLPVSWAGLLLMLLAGAFVAAEPFVVSHGALAVAGAVCFFRGLLLFQTVGRRLRGLAAAPDQGLALARARDGPDGREDRPGPPAAGGGRREHGRRCAGRCAARWVRLRRQGALARPQKAGSLCAPAGVEVEDVEGLELVVKPAAPQRRIEPLRRKELA